MPHIKAGSSTPCCEPPGSNDQTTSSPTFSTRAYRTMMLALGVLLSLLLAPLAMVIYLLLVIAAFFFLSIAIIWVGLKMSWKHANRL